MYYSKAEFLASHFRVIFSLNFLACVSLKNYTQTKSKSSLDPNNMKLNIELEWLLFGSKMWLEKLLDKFKSSKDL